MRKVVITGLIHYKRFNDERTTSTSGLRFGAVRRRHQPVELVAPWPPGGGTDSLGRAFADAARPHIPRAIPVINKSGASGAIGYAYTLMPPLEYKIAVISPEVLLLPHIGLGKTKIADDPLAVTVRADAPWNTIEEFIAYAKQKPNTVTISIAGNGTTHHVGAVALAKRLASTLPRYPIKAQHRQSWASWRAMWLLQRLLMQSSARM